MAAAAKATQKAEGERHLHEAKKAMGTSWWSFKCRSDNVTASLEYAAAATCFRAAQMLPEAIEALTKAADLQEQQFDSWTAARSYETAGGLCDGLDTGGPAAAAENWQEAARCYRMAGKAGTAAKVLLKLAGLHEKEGEIPSARQAWVDALAVLQDAEDEVADLTETYQKYVGFLVRSSLIEPALEATDECIQVLRRQKLFSFIHKELLGKVVLILHLNKDTVRAQEVLDNSPDVEGWFTCRESKVGYALVEAFRENDAEALKTLIKDQIFSFLQIEVARVARKLEVPVVEAEQPKFKPEVVESFAAADATKVGDPEAADAQAATSHLSTEATSEIQPQVQNLGALLM